MSDVLKDKDTVIGPQGGDGIELMIVGPEGEARMIGALDLFGALLRPAPVHDFDPTEGIGPKPSTDGQGVENPNSI